MQRADFDKTLEDCLDSIHRFTGFGPVFYGQKDAQVLAHRHLNPFCRACLDDAGLFARCRFIWDNAIVQSLASGEPFYYTCWAGLLFFLVAVAPYGECRGGISIGGFFPQDDENATRRGVGDRNPDLSKTVVRKLKGLLPTVPSVSSRKLRGLGHYVLEATFSSGLNSAEFFRKQSEKYGQQREIADAIRARDVVEQSPADLLQQAHTVAHAVLSGRPTERTLSLGNTYLAAILVASQWDLIRFKAHLRVFLALLSQQTVLQGGEWTAATSEEMRGLTRLEECRSIEDACFFVRDLILAQQRAHRAEIEREQSVSEKTIQWLQRHHREKVTLTTAARDIGASSSAIIQRLRAERGRSFRSILEEIRVSEAKRLLATTTLPISEVASLCGFYDQSHFTRVFRKAINLTPGRFRQLLFPDESSVTADRD